MPTHQKILKQERIAAYPAILAIFPSATDMARELSLDNRASVGQWKKRGCPIEYIMILDMLGLVSKEVLMPSVSNWDVYFSKYEQTIKNKLNKMILVDSLTKTASSTLQTIFKPTVEEIVKRVLVEEGVVEAKEEEAPTVSDEGSDLI